ncbi:MAG: tRNA glutamyl-Q(34) synthetase GluQRS [Pseudomonadota bacterium]
MMPGGTHPYRGRFAPSPTGDLHFGSLVAAVGSWVRARVAGGTWIVRIEDLDPRREVPGAAVRIIETLGDFGMASDEPIEYQSQRIPFYRAALERLLAAGAAFECRCSRGDLGADAIHRACVVPSDAARTPAYRLRAPAGSICFHDPVQGRYCQDLAQEVGDFVIWRADSWPAYQLAAVVDDAAQGINEVVRGADLLDSTPRQLLLQRLLGLPTPDYFHLPLAVDAAGAKLGKSSGSLAIDPRDPMPALRAALAFLGWPRVPFRDLRSPEAALALACLDFDPARLPRARALPVPGIGD